MIAGSAWPDKLRRSDVEAFKALAGQESRVVVGERKLADDVFLRKTMVVDEIYDFYDSDEDVSYRFNIRKIKDAIVANKIEYAMFRATVPDALYEYVLKNNGVEEARVAQMTIEDLKRPGLLALWPNDLSSIIDGNHRLVARWRRGLKTFRYAAFDVRNVADFMLVRKGKSENVR